MNRAIGWRSRGLAGSLVLELLCTSSDAVPVRFRRVEANVDWVSAGISGVGGGSGTITVSGVSGQVKRVFLYWHGIDQPTSGGNGAYDNAEITINAQPITGTAIGDATTNCWPNLGSAGGSRAFRANVTPFVAGNGTYALTGLSAKSGHSANGASLVVIFDDGNSVNDRDLVFFEGNDSNLSESFPGETDGWHSTLTGINYPGGSVQAQLHVADGQDFAVGLEDPALTFASDPNSTVVISDAVGRYDGTSVVSAGDSRSNAGELWDIHNFDISGAFGAAGMYTLTLDSPAPNAEKPNEFDCLGLILLLLDLPAGAAPPSPVPSEPPNAWILAVAAVLGLAWLRASAFARRRRAYSRL